MWKNLYQKYLYQRTCAGRSWKNTPYACDHCERSFGLEWSLKTHISSIHKKAKCDECNQEFSNSFMLKRHKAKVHGTKSSAAYQCDFCPLVYEQKTSLDKHIAKNHSNSEHKTAI